MSQSNARSALRIGLIREGRILTERTLAIGVPVTVGSADDCTLVIQGPTVPESHALFIPDGSAYRLQIKGDMPGRVTVPVGSGEVEELIQSGVARREGEVFVVQLDRNSKGRLRFGDYTVLFQFIEEEPKAVRPVLPQSIVTGGEVDWTFSAFVLGAFAFLFSVGLGLSQVDPVASTSIEMIPDDLVHLMIEEPEEPEVTDTTEQTTDESQESQETQRDTSSTPQVADRRDVANNAEAQASLANDVANQVMNEILGANGGDASNIVQNVLAGGHVDGNLGDQLAGSAGTGVANGQGLRSIREAAGGGGSGVGGGLGTLQGGGVRTTSADTTDLAEERPRGRTVAGSSTATGGSGNFDTSQVSSRLRSLAPSMNRCYEQQLAVTPTLEGRVSVRFTILESGSITGVQVDGGNGALQQCVSTVLGRLRFNPGPEGGSVSYSTSFVFNPGN